MPHHAFLGSSQDITHLGVMYLAGRPRRFAASRLRCPRATDPQKMGPSLRRSFRPLYGIQANSSVKGACRKFVSFPRQAPTPPSRRRDQPLADWSLWPRQTGPLPSRRRHTSDGLFSLHA